MCRWFLLGPHHKDDQPGQGNQAVSFSMASLLFQMPVVFTMVNLYKGYVGVEEAGI